MEFCGSNGRLQPGFRFHPTDVELVMYYLKRKVLGKRLEPAVVSEVDIYKFHPMDLRDLACMKKDLYWYFFCPRGKKYGSGERTNRATNTGFWKATGNDRIVSYQQRPVGKIKTLIFHKGRPPKGERTDWVMHEFKLEDKNLADAGMSQDSYVLCKIFKKSGMGPKNAEQYGAPFVEEEWSDDDEVPNCAQLVPADVQIQSVSAVTNVLGCCTNASEQVVDQALISTPNGLVPNYCNAVSMAADWASSSMIYSDVDQSPAPTSNAAANLALSSKGLILNYNDAANLASSSKGLILNYNDAANLASSSKGLFLNYNPAVDQTTATTPMPNYCVPAADQMPTSMPGVADIASTSMGHVSYLDDDEIFTVDDLSIFGDLEDLDNEIVQGNESTFGSFYEGGMDLTDLD